MESSVLMLVLAVSNMCTFFAIDPTGHVQFTFVGVACITPLIWHMFSIGCMCPYFLHVQVGESYG